MLPEFNEHLIGYKINNMFISGSNGSGKSIVSKLIMKDAKEKMIKNNANGCFDYIEIECMDKTNIEVLNDVLKFYNKDADVPEHDDNYIKEYLDNLVVIRNEINKKSEKHSFYNIVFCFNNVDYLKENLKPKEKRKFDGIYGLVALNGSALVYPHVQISVILMSTNKNLLKEIDKETLDKLELHHIHFKNYNAEEVFAILKQYSKEVFRSSAISDVELKYLANIIANEYQGNIKLAYSILQNTGLRVEELKHNKITIEDIDYAFNIFLSNL